MGFFKNLTYTIGHVLKRYMFAGLATVLPIFITVYILVLIVQFSENVVGKYVNQLLKPLLGFQLPGLGVVIILVVICVAGYFSRLYIGKQILPLIDGLLRRLPVISQIYPPAKQFSDLVFTTEGKKHFNRVVLVPYPSEKSYALGFVTNEEMEGMKRKTGENLIGVLVPFGPTPFTGVLLYYPDSDVIDLDVPIDSAIKTIVSAGVISPVEAKKQREDV